MKDNFSSNSDKYAQFRPTYPSEFFEFLSHVVTEKDTAWDVGTGNGQVAFELAKIFEKVYATDISQTQIDNAKKADNIYYSVQPAESSGFSSDTFDLITIAQAIHWFDFEKFYDEVRRTAKKNALICVIGYSLMKFNPAIDELLLDFYTNVVGPYWDPERNYLQEQYKTIPFPFEEICTPSIENVQHWSLDRLIGYLNTWSAVGHYIRENGMNPVDPLQKELELVWGDQETHEVHFPLHIRLGRI